MLKIALDFDETITADPDTFYKMICLFRDAGHEVKIVTARQDDGRHVDIDAFIGLDDIDVIYCEGQQKRSVCASLGWNPDIWIDDFPENIPANCNWCNIGCKEC